ncbi:hypothetical protein B296_00004984 [Ensete ventricosum]|uniref:Uncharacterized protein n=1 Tax=Ensete ventricosum TaxID=4639 RepID=A0A426ZLC4_ENSVE|nr:hypothetical protein B296_00004984 [Ensete ventricosum]
MSRYAYSSSSRTSTVSLNAPLHALPPLPTAIDPFLRLPSDARNGSPPADSQPQQAPQRRVSDPLSVLADWAYIFTVLIILLLLFCISAKRLSSYLPFKGEQHSSSPRTTISSYRVLVVYMNWKATLKSISPLLFLGFGRLITTTGVDYQVGSSTQHLFCICYFGVKSHKKFFCTVQPGVCYACLCTEFSGLSIQMAYSLQANVLTGLVNLSMDTLSAAPVTAVGVLLGYSFALSAVTALVWFCGIKLKFW